MKDFLSSLISRNQKPQTQVQPRLGSLFEPPPLTGAAISGPSEPAGDDPMRGVRTMETPRQSTVPPPPPAAPGQRPSAATREEPSGSNPPSGSRPAIHAALHAPDTEVTGDRGAADRWAQGTVRPIQPGEPLRSVEAPPSDGAFKGASDAQALPQMSDPPIESRTESTPVIAPSSSPHLSAVRPQQAGEPLGRTVQGRTVRRAATVTPPASREVRGRADTQPPARSQRRDPTPIRPARIASVAGDAALQSPAAIVARPARADQARVSAPPPPTIRVSIGRIEVRANVQEPPQPRPTGHRPVRRQPALSLTDYLKQREGGP